MTDVLHVPAIQGRFHLFIIINNIEIIIYKKHIKFISIIVILFFLHKCIAKRSGMLKSRAATTLPKY
jgi:hypothetical protein